MNWMNRWPGPFPLFVASARGARLTDVDGHRLRRPVPRRHRSHVRSRTGRHRGRRGPPGGPGHHHHAADGRRGLGGRASWPGASACPVGRSPCRPPTPTASPCASAGPSPAGPRSSSSTGATTARSTRRSRCWDRTGRSSPDPGNLGPQVDPAITTRVVEFNDLDALERELAAGDVACVLAEPALTNIGIVLPDPGFHAELRRLTREAGTLLIIDETHTLCAGPGGYTAAHGLEPDLLTLGKPIAGGVPAAAYGFTLEVAEALRGPVTESPDADVSGVGGTLTANALAVAAMRATLGEVLTDAAWDTMIPLAGRWADGVAGVIAHHELAWTVQQLGLSRRVLVLPATTPRRRGGGCRRPRARRPHAPLRPQPRGAAHARSTTWHSCLRPPPRRTSTSTPRCSRPPWPSSWPDTGRGSGRPGPGRDPVGEQAELRLRAGPQSGGGCPGRPGRPRTARPAGR